jgi:hypothetical protein
LSINRTAYTLAFDEWYDASRGYMRADGRMAGSNVTEVIDLNTGRLYQFNTLLQPYESVSPCRYITIDKEVIMHSILRPSVEFFSILGNTTEINLPKFSYLGTTRLARNLLCDYWRTKVTWVYQNFTMEYTAVFYFAVGYIPGQQRVPVRVELQGARATLNLPPGSVDPFFNVYHHVYDFM